jgi:type IV secretion system pilin
MLRNKTLYLTTIIIVLSVIVGMVLPFSHVYAAGGDLTLDIDVAKFPSSETSVTLTASPHEIGNCGTQITIQLTDGSGVIQCVSGAGEGIGGSPGGEGTNLSAPDTDGSTGTWSSSSAIGTPGAECTDPEPTNAICINMPSDSSVTVAQLTVTYGTGSATTPSNSGSTEIQCDSNGNVVPTGQANSSPGSCLPEDPCACVGNNQPAYCQASQTLQSCQSVSGISGWLDAAIDFLGIGIGIIITTMIVIGGIQYITSGGDPQSVASAKRRIANALIALVAFAFMFAILQFIIPGGIF